ncbi:TRAP transporter large permease [Pseudooceanicola atlanticus]|uniref:TRAP transporter large permease protein n=1 Tax=Pseudooceanicola atlanticus TaxID=1461694 RepID=A0A0A0EEW6_9RHOB|nr:TRAP transporter large permease [Pseudooceanicola atlanticus]KGM48643.1 C4-dicarboxylate ABC transporter permease [Pseudooceanicola atlanticus]
MTGVEIGIYSIVAILVLIQLGMHVAIALMTVSFFGVYLVKGKMIVAGALLSQAALDGVERYSFGVIPLFVLMGVLVGVCGLGRDVFDVAGQMFRKFRGGLGIATVFANAVFAAVNGTSIASASVFTKVAVPELIRQGYTPRFSVGVVAGSSVLGMLIPPSLLLILFGIIAEVSIGDLFTAGIVPGLILAFFFCAAIVLLARFFPGFTGNPGASDLTIMSRGTMLLKSAPIILLIVLVLGGIYGGFFTPTEAGGVGALGALVIAMIKGRLTGREIWKIMLEVGQVTASITFLIIAAHMYSRLLALTGLPNAMTGLLSSWELGLYGVLVLYLIAIVLLGTILDSSSILLILLPLILPVIQPFGVDLVWFGIMTIIAVEVGLLTPPLGVACFVIKANLEDDRITLNDIFAGAAPFALIMVLLVALVIGMPWLAIGLL